MTVTLLNLPQGQPGEPAEGPEPGARGCGGGGCHQVQDWVAPRRGERGLSGGTTSQSPAGEKEGQKSLRVWTERPLQGDPVWAWLSLRPLLVCTWGAVAGVVMPGA